MRLDLRLNDLPQPRVAAFRLVGALRTLQELTSRNLARATQGVESRQFKNRKEQMKQRLMKRGKSVSFEQATDEDGRDRILLSLYLEYATRPDAPWLPAFDESVANSVLGENGRDWHPGRRRQATQLFFTHFDQLPYDGLQRLCALLAQAYECIKSEGQRPVAQWRHHRNGLFSPLGPQNAARSALPEETLPSLMGRFAIPNDGRFAECLRQVFLLKAIRDCPLGEEIPALAEIETLKTERASASQLMGAAALQIMVQRVAKEAGRTWSGDWPRWITRLGCDPRHGRATAEGAKWWNWATADELRLAQQGVTGLTLRFFIDFLRRSLQGTDKEPQFELRSRFLIGLFEARKIQEARLALNRTTYERLDKKYRDSFNVIHLSQTSDDTSMICLKCTDDIYIIEGTHSFGLRVFHQAFPIRDFWEIPKRTYQDRSLRISPDDCDAYLRHDPGGNWVDGFFRILRYDFHVEWSDVRLGDPMTVAPSRVVHTHPGTTPSAIAPPSPASQPSRLIHTINRGVPAIDLRPTQEAGAKAGLVVEDYIQHLASFLRIFNKNDEIDHRARLLRHLVETGKVRAARLILDTSNRPMLMLKCKQDVMLVDAVNYTKIRGLSDDFALWHFVENAPNDGARAVRLNSASGYQLRVSHLPSEGYAKRFLDELAEKCGVAWDDVVF
jgi:hypothetical protein